MLLTALYIQATCPSSMPLYIDNLYREHRTSNHVPKRLTINHFIVFQCKKNENFRKHMLLLWQNNVPMSIEVREFIIPVAFQPKLHRLHFRFSCVRTVVLVKPKPNPWKSQLIQSLDQFFWSSGQWPFSHLSVELSR